jgi:RNA polymerase sigma factor (sigma-70 family)
MTFPGPAPERIGPSDEALVAGMANGDEWAATAFIRRYQRRVFGLALRMLGEESAAEDAAQEALTRAWAHAAVFDPGRASVSTWVLTIARNVAIDALRSRRSLPTADDELAFLVDSASEHAGETSSARLGLEAGLRELPGEQRRALVLAGVFGYTAAEVAHSEKIPLGTAKTRIRSGMLKLREILTKQEELQ